MATIAPKDLDFNEEKGRTYTRTAVWNGWKVCLVADEYCEWADLVDPYTWGTFYRNNCKAQQWDGQDAFEEWASLPEQKGLQYQTTNREEVFFITRAQRWEWYGKGSKGIKKAKASLASMVADRKAVLDGDVWGIKVFSPTGEELEACWGFVGYDYATEEAARMLGDVATYTETKDCNGNLKRIPILEEA